MRARRHDTEVRRDQIAQAVLALAVEHGVSSMSVAAVAHRVGVAPSALYRHYPSKDAMLAGTLERVGTRMLGNLQRAREGTGSALEALERLLQLQVQLVRENRGMPLVLFSEAVSQNPANRRPIVELMTRFLGALADLVREAQAEGDVRADVDPATVAVSFVGLYVPPAILWNITRGRFDITAQARRAWPVFLEGLRPTPTPPRTRRTRRARQEKPA